MNRGVFGAIVQSFVVCMCGCGERQAATLTPDDLVLVRQTGTPESLALEMKQFGANLQRLTGMDDAGNATELPGVTVEVSYRSSKQAAKALQIAAPPGYYAFVSARNYGINEEPDLVSVMKAADPYEIILAMGTNGWNYDLSPAQVVDELKQWDREYGLVFRGIAFDWLEAEFTNPPSDMRAFAERVYKFCPDVVDQGTETVDELAREMQRENSVYLWWD